MGTLRPFLRVSPGSFNPPPKVNSSLILLRIERRRRLAGDGLWKELMRGAFAQRRKTLANNLLSAGFPKNLIADAMEECQIPSNARAEELLSPQWFSLYSLLKENAKNEECRP